MLEELFSGNELNEAIKKYCNDYAKANNVIENELTNSVLLDSIVPSNRYGVNVFTDLFINNISIGETVSRVYLNIAEDVLEASQ